MLFLSILTKEVVMKLFNYSTWYLLFTSIMHAVSGYTCPNISMINRKITQNDPMRFPLPKGGIETDREVYFQYSGNNNKIEKFYKGKSKVDKFTGVYYHPHGTLTCAYKQKNNRYLLLPMTERGARRINGAVIANDIESKWRPHGNSSFYVCGDGATTRENLDDCQFSLKPL